MTTTLRPSGPEERTPDGGRRRAYDICDNGRPVGTVVLAAAPWHGRLGGRIERLAVAPPDRRRGRATVAALAAEEVLRGWGCERVEAGLPAADGPAPVALAAALGYAESGRSMVKELSGVPALPPDSVPRPMTAREYDRWAAADRALLAGRLAGCGLPREAARAAAERAQRELLPDGPATRGMSLSVLAHRGTDVGTLWVRRDGAPGAGAEAWVYAVAVEEEHRGRGHGRTLMLAAERECAAAGVRLLGLHVHAGNTPARRLYDGLGYRTAERRYGKTLR
ncbi:GNAT family N-acetyltransferase [Streptomyces sp. JJ36]|uniref:GNAT family N-acetyltransferase n=1 Tax=Streptomyces sp. JJ36 TaxID=2736645 RepID=UPI001F026052|nr:GNAT family N-acetyltransferase [Streptomyces sp. JJ36]MCF6525286.1 GNAT family N-acetyltransferase [Streptomyces sp. JJ36]